MYINQCIYYVHDPVLYNKSYTTLSITLFNLSVFNLPQLPQLIKIKIINVTGLNHDYEFPDLVNGLEILHLESDRLSDERVDHILSKIKMGPSVNTLTYLDLDGNNLTRIPTQLKTFQGLLGIFLQNQQIMDIQPGDFHSISITCKF